MPDKPNTVTLRALRNNLGDYVHQVLVTRSPITITERGRPVALLTPIPIEEAHRVSPEPRP